MALVSIGTYVNQVSQRSYPKLIIGSLSHIKVMHYIQILKLLKILKKNSYYYKFCSAHICKVI